MSRLAIIGTGIAGMGSAHFLHRHFELTVFEQNNYIGGHTHTVSASEPGTGREVPVDTGFMVFNYKTYPQLTRLFSQLDVPVKPAPMSFAVRDDTTGLEWCGSSLNLLFAQRKNLLNLRFIRMLAAVNRFNREALAALDDPATARISLGDYVRLRRYGDDFYQLYLVPMSSAVWSTPPDKMFSFPAATLLRFFFNHGFLGLKSQHPWFTVDGGSREYRDRLIAPWKHRIRINQAVKAVRRHEGKIHLTLNHGTEEIFDRVIIATHANQALALLADPTADESRLLGQFHYQDNIATLHTDASVMPRTRRAWSSWNYQLSRGAGGQLDPATHYWMNSLQGVSERENYFVTINRPDAIDPAKVIRRINYAHPLFNLAALHAQLELPGLNQMADHSTRTYFAGSYFRYGFHEDAFLSALNVSHVLLREDPWTATPARAPAAPTAAA